MTDKIDPGWISDRLPKKKDGDHSGDVYLYTKGKKLPDFIQFQEVEEGDTWRRCKDKDGNHISIDDIVLPQECVDREKGEISLNEYAEVQMTKEAYNAFTDKIKALELENKELSEAWKTLLKHNDQEDLLSDKLEAENKKLIIDLELFREGEKGYEKGYEKEVDYYKNLFELEAKERKVIEGYLEDEHNQNDILRKLLIKEWGG